MSFFSNVLFGGVKESDDPTGLSGNTQNTEAQNEPIVEGVFYPRTLYKFNGHDDEKIFIAVLGKVYDCTAGRSFYGPSGPYSNFAGRDASRGLGLNSFDMECVRDWDQPIDDLSDLPPQAVDAAREWQDYFAKKYPCIGTLEPEPGVNY